MCVGAECMRMHKALGSISSMRVHTHTHIHMKLTTMTDDWIIFHFWEVSEVGSPWFWTRTTPIYLSFSKAHSRVFYSPPGSRERGSLTNVQSDKTRVMQVETLRKPEAGKAEVAGQKDAAWETK